MARLLWRPGELPLVEGTATWRRAALQLPAVLDLGEVQVEARAQDDGSSTIVWQADPGAVDTEGTLTLEPPTAYALSLRIAPVGKVEPGVQSALRLLGRPGPDGSYRVQYAGSLASATAP